MKPQLIARWILLMLLIAALACNFPTPTPEVPQVSEELTPLPDATETPELPDDPLIPGPTPTEAPPVAGEDGCTLRAAYVADVTVPDNTVMDKGETFIKTWRLRNSGTCTWEAGTRLVYVSGEALATTSAVDVPVTAPDAMVDVSVPMQAPTTPGTYRSNWQMETADGKRYGGVFYAQIIVEGEPTATPSPSPSPTPTEGPGATPPTNFAGEVAEDCSRVTLTWTDGRGESTYRISGPGFSVDLAANTTRYVWEGPPTGSATLTLIALDAASAEIGRATTTVNVSCATTGGPDLVLQSVTFEPATPVAYLPLKVTVAVRNVGDADADTFLVRWWGGKNFSAVSCEWEVAAGLSAGASKQLTCQNFTFSSPYSNLITRAEADPTGLIAETNKANNVLERTINVVRPITVYDFVNQAPQAVWQAGDPFIALDWDGAKGDANGFARWDNGPMENNVPVQNRCLEMHPKSVANGWITGTYIDLYQSNYVIQKGDMFYARVGLLHGASAGNVTFRVMLRTANAGNHWIGERAHTYGQGIRTLRVDLSDYVGERADVVLRVDAGASAEQDSACWTQAVIYRYP